MRITFVTRKFGNVERNSHCDVLHITPIRVARLFLDCNGDFAIKAYCTLYSTVVGRNLWICDIHGSACTIDGSIVCAEIHGYLLNLWIMRRMQIISLYSNPSLVQTYYIDRLNTASRHVAAVKLLFLDTCVSIQADTSRIVHQSHTTT